jgi:hypothetical protein
MEMAKRMVMRTHAEGRVLLGMVIIKWLQMLVWWVRDQQKCGLALVATNFDEGNDESGIWDEKLEVRVSQ